MAQNNHFKNIMQFSSLIIYFIITNLFVLVSCESDNTNKAVVTLPDKDSGTRIMTLGYGTFIILCGFAVSGCICFFSRATGKQE